MNGEHTCTFVEEREPSGRLIVGPCLGCTKPAFSALADAQATVEALQKKYDDLLGKYHQLMDFYDKHNGTPCEQIRHEQQVEALQRENECKDTLIETLQAQLAQRGKDGENE